MKKDSSQKLDLIAVLGIHRSGTSAITRGLQCFGVNLGQNLMQPSFDNVKGFWEDVDLVNLNQDILTYLNLDYDHASPVTATHVQHLIGSGYLLKAASLIRQKIRLSRPFGIKDPRLAKLMPFWKEVFQYCQLNVGYVIAIRNPISVAKSLEGRNGFSFEKSYMLWLDHTLAALLFTQGEKRVVIDFDMIIESPLKEVDRLAKAFDLTVDANAVSEYASDFLDENLRHSVDQAQDLAFDPRITPLIGELYSILREAAKADSSLLMSEEQLAYFQKGRDNLGAVMKFTDEQHQFISQLQQAVAERDGQLATLNQAVAERDGQLATLNQAVAERDGKLATLRAVVESAKAWQKRSWAKKAFHKWRPTAREWTKTSIMKKVERSIRKRRNKMRNWLAYKKIMISKWLRKNFIRLTFDPKYYLEKYPDVATAGIDPFFHYINDGRREGRFKNQKKEAKVNIKTKRELRNLEALKLLSLNRFDDETLSNHKNIQISTPDIDISIVTYNSAKWVKQFFESLVSQKYPLSKINIIIVDNGSIDNTVDILKSEQKKYKSRFGDIKIIEQNNIGFGAGHHRAILEGESPYFLVTNIDLKFKENSIHEVLHEAIIDYGKSVACWELRQIPYEHPKYYDPVSKTTNWCSHACILIKRDAYVKIGGYDKKIFMYCEDVEISYRFRSYGYALKYVPKAVVEHYTYEYAHEVKPMQYLGGIVGNIYIRSRYGNFRDIVEGFKIYLNLCSKEKNKNYKKILIKNIPLTLVKAACFIFGKGSSNAEYPIRGLDYELQRMGAFYPIHHQLNKDLPLVSIIIRTYQGRGYLLRQAITSVINQTYTNIEIIVSEDGGEYLKDISDATINRSQTNIALKYISNKKVGRSATGNAGMAAAAGKYMMFLDDDDLLFADHVETLVFALQNGSGLSGAYSLAFEVPTEFDKSNENYEEHGFNTLREMIQEWDYDLLLKRNLFPIQSVLFERRLYEERGGFDITLEYLEDWNLWLRYGHKNTFKFVAKTTSIYRVPYCKKNQDKRNEYMKNAYDESFKKALISSQSNK